MSQARLNRLATMYIYRNVDVNIDALIDEFAKSNRRLVFKILLFIFILFLFV